MMNNNKREGSVSEYALAEIGVTRIDLKAVPRKIGEVLEEIAPTGERVKAADVVGEEITIHSIRPFVGEYGPAAFVVCTDSKGALFNMVVGQKIVLAKLITVMDQLPVSGTLTRHDGGRFGLYYDIE